ncbi:MAG TPA: DUF3098 domain-containing protein [Bacteroidales bacterium]|nr:DUF3098 domain-containing protein [Bacteroidales bacterium]HPR57648.1 DUF3098 domain-containing protein [Bacteroidales bacterium]HRW97407.1 DUF3098 domain-containing protein [Bacteroidales bacterium]
MKEKPDSSQKSKMKPGITSHVPQENKDSAFVFEKTNYRLLLIGIAFLVVGFLLMIGGSSNSPDYFNYEMFNFQRLTLAPVLLIIGYAIGIFAIMKRPSGSDKN